MKGVRGRGERVEATLKNYRNSSSTIVLLNWNNSHIDFSFLKTMSHNVALSGLGTCYVDQTGLELKRSICLCTPVTRL